jgi:hypothetical protein
MPTTAIGNTPGGSGADLVQHLKSDLANGIASGPRAGAAKTGGGSAPGRGADVASVLMSEVATSDISKLSSILDPAPDPSGSKVLDSLLRAAVQEVANGNSERAVGYLADYATRDPRRAEALPLQPELEPVRDKIDSMVNRMASVAKMSAEDGLSRAEQTAADLSGKMTNWDTSADVLVKLAQRLYDAGGYANYSRSAELAKVVSDAGLQIKAHNQALAAAASAAVSAPAAPNPMTEMLPGINVPYWADAEVQLHQVQPGRRLVKPRRKSSGSLEDLRENLVLLKEISSSAVSQLWFRAPLLVVLLSWFFFGLAGGVFFAIGSRIWPDSLFVAIGNLAFTLWGLGFLAMVGFGFYARVRYSRRYR